MELVDSGAEPQIQADGDAEPQSQPRDYESEARQLGWRPLEEFKGDPSKHVDEETFVRRADEIMPLLKKKDQAQRREIDDLKKQVKRLTRAEQNAYESALADLRNQQREAVQTGDIREFDRISERIDKVSEDIKADVDDLPGGEDPREVFDTFRESHTWYDKAELGSASEIEVNGRLYADRLAQKWAAQGMDKTMKPSEFFAKVAEAVEDKYPLLRSRASRPKPVSDVAGPTRIGGGSKTKTGANLPPDAKAQATRFYNQGVIKGASLSEALDKYAKNYDWTA